MVFSEYIKLRILYHCNNGLKPYTIAKMLLEEEGIRVSKVGVWKFLKVYKSTGSTMRRYGSGRITKITQRVKELVNQQMEKDDETTATQLHRLLNDNGIDISLRTVLR
jgi:Fe2+ or Zn2+ uptake regulation protein